MAKVQPDWTRSAVHEAGRVAHHHLRPDEAAVCTRPGDQARRGRAVADGALAWALVMREQSTATYAGLCERLAAAIPRDSHVLALSPYWFCLAPRVDAYRSLLVPFLIARTRLTPESLDDAFEAADANIVVLDRPMLGLMAKPDLMGTGLHTYLARHSTRHIVVEDRSYGRFEIHYLLPRVPAVETVEARP